MTEENDVAGYPSVVTDMNGMDTIDAVTNDTGDISSVAAGPGSARDTWTTVVEDKPSRNLP